MGKIRTLVDFQDAIDEETGWRKQELAQAMSNLNLTIALPQRVALRAAIALLYAHWEGWVKAVAKLYIRYANSQRLRLKDLSAPFLGNALKARIDAAADSKSAAVHSDLAVLILNGLDVRAQLSEDLVRTESNLSSRVFSDILARLGIADDFFSTAESHLIDDRLVKLRNSIAHGEFESLAPDDYRSMHRDVLLLLEIFTARVIAAASQRAFQTQ